MSTNPIICAIDTPDLSSAKKLIKEISPNVGLIKLGLEFYTACGTEGVKEIVKTGVPVFLDLKFHDIPNTVEKAVEAASGLGVAMITIHTSGGKEMIKAAVKGASIMKQRPLILAVTVLTSLDESDMKDIGFQSVTASEQVMKLAKLAVENGVDGLVCSANELAGLKKIYKNKIKLVVPGIRPEGSSKDDQKRHMTPEMAIKEGADYLVIGRPITKANDPARAAKEIRESLKK